MELYVLGAGFSKSFVQSAPLINGFFRGNKQIIEEPRFRPVQDFMQECRFNVAHVNIETLMTLADEYGSDETNELLKELIVEVLKAAFPTATWVPEQTPGETWYKFRLPEDKECVLRCLARDLLTSTTERHVLTFNYDVLLENAIELEQAELKRNTSNRDHRRFHAGRCHGFHAHKWTKRGDITLQAEQKRADHIFVLKLHGSMTWRVPKPSEQQFSPDTVVVLSASEENIGSYPLAEDTIDTHMDVIPLIVPPVLDKSKALGHDAFQEIWAKAACLIEQAKRLVFVGYSFPPTDYRAEYLFRRHFARGCAVEVIDCQENDAERTHLKRRYDSIFGEANITYHWDDAANALKRMI